MPNPRTKKAAVNCLPEGEVRSLLITWMVRQIRTPVDAPLEGEHPDWAWLHEQHHGVGFLQRRRELLEDALSRLARKGVPLDEVAAAIQQGKYDCLLAELSDFRLTGNRDLADKARTIRREARRALGAWLRLHDRVNPDRLPVLGRYRAIVETAYEAVKTDPLINPPTGASLPQPRRKRGRPRLDWRHAVRRRLTDLRVSRSIQDQLLRAVGLLELTETDRH